MPILKSSTKDLRRSARRAEQNRVARGALRTAIKRARAGLAAKDATATRTALATALPAIDRAVAKGLLHKNAAARTKSRLARQANRLAGSQTP